MALRAEVLNSVHSSPKLRICHQNQLLTKLLNFMPADTSALAAVGQEISGMTSTASPYLPRSCHTLLSSRGHGAPLQVCSPAASTPLASTALLDSMFDHHQEVHGKLLPYKTSPCRPTSFGMPSKTLLTRGSTLDTTLQLSSTECKCTLLTTICLFCRSLSAAYRTASLSP